MKEPKSCSLAKSENTQKYSNHVQWIAAAAVLMLKVQLGIYVGWASPNLARLATEESPIPITSSDVSWMASIPSITAVFGAIIGSIVMEYVGSRKTIILTYLFMGICWTCLLVADSVAWLYISRIIGGFATGILTCCFSIYLGEVSAPEIRGTLIVLSIIGSPAGAALGVIAETYLQMKVSCSIYLLVALIGVSMFLWLKDTPYYLTQKNDINAVKESIRFYRPNVDMERELNEITAFTENSNGFKNKLRKLKVITVRKSLLMVVVASLLPQACGVLTVKPYMEIILIKAEFTAIKPQEMVIYSYIISVLSVFLAMNLIDRSGRRSLVILSSIGTTVSLIALGLHFYLVGLHFDAKDFQWLPVASLITYLISYAIGFEIITGTLMSEMFPQHIKSTAACVIILTASVFGFILTKSYHHIVEYAGEAYAFWGHAILSSLGVPYAVFWLIETKGKKFHEIQDKLHSRCRLPNYKSDDNCLQMLNTQK